MARRLFIVLPQRIMLFSVLALKTSNSIGSGEMALVAVS